MQTMQLVLAAVMVIQRPAAPPSPQLEALQLARQLDALQGLQGLEGLSGLAGLEGLPGLEGLQGFEALQGFESLEGFEALEGFEGVAGFEPVDEQDPTDSLWRAARQAFNRGDYTSAANLYGDLNRRYPNATRAGDALYWAAFALYKNDDLGRARSLLVTQQRRYPKAATLRDGDALLARIQTALAKQGDEEAHRWVSAHAEPPAGTDSTRTKGCLSDDDDDDMRVAALNGLLQMDAANALPILRKVLARRD